MRPADWLPPLVWMAVIFGLSSSLGSSEETSRFVVPLLRWLFPWAAPGDIAALHGLVRKGGHLTEYAVLAALWFRVFRRGRRLAPGAAAWSALTISIAWAGIDEWHQSFVPARTASAWDVVLDGASAALALLFVVRGWRTALDGATAVLLWLAAAGGAVVLAIDLWADVPSRALWLTTPAALALLLARRRLRRRSPDAGGRRASGVAGAARDP
jgi:VanZ family protein